MLFLKIIRTTFPLDSMIISQNISLIFLGNSQEEHLFMFEILPSFLVKSLSLTAGPNDFQLTFHVPSLFTNFSFLDLVTVIMEFISQNSKF